MNALYKSPDLYDLGYDNRDMSYLKEYYTVILKDKNIRTIHDCSIGTGHLTFPLDSLGYEISGSDISHEMLNNAKINAADKAIEIELFQSDFRSVSTMTEDKFDCVMATGNSLAHVDNDGVKLALESMSQLVKDNGYLYIDTRNWDRILQRKQRFYYYNPFYHNDERINLVQVWDYISNSKMVFNLLYTFEKDNELYRKEEQSVTYYPVYKDLIINELKRLGYGNIEINNFPNFETDKFQEMGWYSIIAKKNI